jgi:hypothetical protein
MHLKRDRLTPKANTQPPPKPLFEGVLGDRQGSQG